MLQTHKFQISIDESQKSKQR